MKAKLLKITIAASLAMTSTFSAAEERACSEFGMGVIYKDTLYGLGTGIILTGLTIVAVDNYRHSTRKLAAGGLIGAGLGAGIGVLEVLTRDCNRSASIKAGWEMPKLVYHFDQHHVANSLPNLGINFTYNFDNNGRR